MFFSFATLLCGLSTFLYGVRLLSTSLTPFANQYLSQKLKKKTHPMQGLALGCGGAGLLHSSGTVCIFALSLCSSGAISLAFAQSLILGANIGTTFTGLFAALSSFDLSKYLGLLVLLGLVLGFCKHPKAQALSPLCTASGLIFVGLSLSSSAFATPQFAHLLTLLFANFQFAPLLLLFSLLFTALVQSSTLTATLAISLATSGILPTHLALFVVLGADAGTCATTLLASIGQPRIAKQLAYFQVAFNVFSTLIVGALLFALLPLLQDPINQANPPFLIALFHFGFNTFGALMVLPFLHPKHPKHTKRSHPPHALQNPQNI
ncbi:MAG: Na/Pi symporter [Firmicutes bacterium]|nr:Na/Pi symporter [Bacillota bacterium]